MNRPSPYLYRLMKTFLAKYKWAILAGIIFLAVMLYLVPQQERYYLEADVKTFRNNKLAPVLIWTGVAISLLVFIINIIKKRSLREAGTALATVAMVVAITLYVLQDLLLSGALYLNRQLKDGLVQRNYVAGYLSGTEQTAPNMVVVDLQGAQLITSRELTDKLYLVGIKEGDTVSLQFSKGLFGVPCDPAPYSDR